MGASLWTHLDHPFILSTIRGRVARRLELVYNLFHWNPKSYVRICLMIVLTGIGWHAKSVNCNALLVGGRWFHTPDFGSKKYVGVDV